ncbi:unnamed protein product [Cercospora beticola]|nr:unnamed protein product [Cercospora beticola]
MKSIMLITILATTAMAIPDLVGKGFIKARHNHQAAYTADRYVSQIDDCSDCCDPGVCYGACYNDVPTEPCGENDIVNFCGAQD